VAVKFLSDEWAAALKAELNAREAFRQAAAGHQATIQQVIAGSDGDVPYWIVIQDSSIDMGTGTVEGADATITENYETAVKLATGELSAVTAFMTGKIKIAGNMGLLLSLQGVLTQLPAAMQAIDVEY
jgi:putative sterol carrier protein